MDRSKLKVRYKRKQGKSPSGRVRSLPWLPILSFLGPGLPLLALGSAKRREPFTKRFQAGEDSQELCWRLFLAMWKV